MKVQYERYGELAQDATFGGLELLSLAAIDDQLNLRTIIPRPVSVGQRRGTTRTAFWKVGLNLIRAEAELVRLAGRLACAVSRLVHKEEELLSVLGESEDEEEREFVKVAVALFRNKRASDFGKLDRLLATLSGERLRSINFRQRIESAITTAGIQTSRLGRSTEATASDFPSTDPEDICPICHELLTTNPDASTASVPFLTRTGDCCNQPYHVSCLLRWLKESVRANETHSTCPTCRAEVPMSFLIEVLELNSEELAAL